MKTGRVASYLAAALCCLACGTGLAVRADDPPADSGASPRANAPVVSLNEVSMPVTLGEGAADGARIPLGHTTETGWYARVSAQNPRSPAVEDGTLVVGSGKGNEVYGYDAQTGKRRWTTTSDDDGISSIAIENGYAYYTTHSCTLEKVRVADGKPEYSVYIAPTVECAPDVEQAEVATAVRESGEWKVSLRETGGNLLWQAPLGDSGAAGAPVISQRNVYITTGNGFLSRFVGATGERTWAADIGAVSAPVVTPWGLMVTTTWDGSEHTKADAVEAAKKRKKRERETKTAPDNTPETIVAKGDRRVALVRDVPAEPTGKAGEMRRGPYVSLDFQGVRPGVTDRHIVFAYDGQVVAVDPVLGLPRWTVELSDESWEFVRPVSHRGLVFVASNAGTVTAIEDTTGAIIWSYKVADTGFVSEPAIDNSNLYLTTMDGLIICLPTGAGTVDGGAPKPVPGDVEGTAAAYWPLQREFRKARDTEGTLVAEEPPAAAIQAGGNPGEGGAAEGAAKPNAIRPREDEANETRPTK